MFSSWKLQLAVAGTVINLMVLVVVLASRGSGSGDPPPAPAGGPPIASLVSTNSTTPTSTTPATPPDADLFETKAKPFLNTYC